MTWWRHQMETFSALMALCAGNSLVTGEFPAQRPVTRSFDVFFDLHSNKRLSKQSWGWWFGTPSRPLNYRKFPILFLCVYRIGDYLWSSLDRNDQGNKTHCAINSDVVPESFKAIWQMALNWILQLKMGLAITWNQSQRLNKNKKNCMRYPVFSY